jgi:hydroxyethylthiazole kinase-like sugar kinase family protein
MVLAAVVVITRDSEMIAAVYGSYCFLASAAAAASALDAAKDSIAALVSVVTVLARRVDVIEED